MAEEKKSPIVRPHLFLWQMHKGKSGSPDLERVASARGKNIPARGRMKTRSRLFLTLQDLFFGPDSPVYLSQKGELMEPEDIEALKTDPRSSFNRAIRDRDVAACLVKTAEIHGHYCPGSAFGVMATLMGLEALGGESSEGMEDLMAIVEINACFADGIQAVSGCTLGNNALVFRDLGKMAVTFVRRNTQDKEGHNGVRVSIRGRIRDHVDRVRPDFFPLMEKVIMARQGSSEEEKAFRDMGRQAAFALIAQPFDTYFNTDFVKAVLPPYAPIVQSLVCPGCGETVMSTKAVLDGDKKGYCRTCAGVLISGVDGRGIGQEVF